MIYPEGSIGFVITEHAYQAILDADDAQKSLIDELHAKYIELKSRGLRELKAVELGETLNSIRPFTNKVKPDTTPLPDEDVEFILGHLESPEKYQETLGHFRLSTRVSNALARHVKRDHNCYIRPLLDYTRNDLTGGIADFGQASLREFYPKLEQVRDRFQRDQAPRDLIP